MPRHPTLPLWIGGDDSGNEENDTLLAVSPSDLALIKKTASENGFKSALDYYESLMSNSTGWCSYLRDKMTTCQNNLAPSAQCDRTKRVFFSDCGGRIIRNSAVEKSYGQIKEQAQAKIRGMTTENFMLYVKKEKEYCTKCKEVGGIGCEQQKEFCNK